MHQHPCRPSHGRRRGVAGFIGLVVLLASCTTTGGSEAQSSDPTVDLDTAAAAESVQATIDRDADPDFCPLGQPEVLTASIAETVDLPDELTSEDNTSVSVLEVGGTDLVFCSFEQRITGPDQLAELTIIAAPGTSLDAETYLEDFREVEDANTTSLEDLAGGTATQMCWRDSQCLVWWQGPDLLVAVMLTINQGALDPDVATAVAQALIPAVVGGLADGTAGSRFDISRSSGDADFDTAAAAVAAQDAIDQGDSLGDCPMGTPTDLVEAAEDTSLLAPDLDESTDNGQVFSGGDVDITYCALFSSDAEPDQIDDLRIDVAPGAGIDIDTYLDEEFVDPSDATSVSVDAIAGGATSAACWDDDEACAVFWQNDDLFIAIVGMSDGEPLNRADLAAVAERLIPVVGSNLAGG